ncbi:MAG: iron ABC transporter permease [Bacteroidota bacterium]
MTQIARRKYYRKLRRDFDQWSWVTLLVTLFVGVPLLFIFFKLFGGAGESWGHMVKYLLPKYLTNTLLLSLICMVLTITMGVSAAWLSTRYHFPLRKSLEWLNILPLALPSYITAYAYAGIFDYGGSLQLLLQGLSLSIPKIDIMNVNGLAFVLSVSLYPYVYVACRAFFLYQSQNLIETAQVLGDSRAQRFFRLILPMARPAIVGGFILVLMEVLNDFGAAKYYGVNTFTTGIFKAWYGYREPETAVYLAALLLVIIFALILLEQWQRKRKRYHFAGKSQKKLARLEVPRGRSWGYTLIVAIPAILGFLIPVAQLIYWAVLSFHNTQWADLFTAIFQSVAIGAIAAAACVFFAILLLFTSQWNALSGVRTVSRFGALGYAIPGAVIAVGVYMPSLVVDKWIIGVVKDLFSVKIGLLLTGTATALVYAYVVRFLAVAFNPLAAGQQKMSASLSEASYLLGWGRLRTFWKLEFPLLRSAILSAFILVFIDVMKELPLTLILKPNHIQTLAVEAYQYASDERIIEAAWPALVLVLSGTIPVIFLNRLVRNE